MNKQPENWNELLLPYEQAVDELVVKFKNLDLSYRRLNLSSPIEQVKGRVKKVSSIIDKAKRRNFSKDEIVEEMQDIGGIRIICRFVEDIDTVVEIIERRNKVDLEVIEKIDYIDPPKESGYRSYHMIVKYPVITAQGFKKVTVEIQIRTLAMNFWATIEHDLKYKYKRKLPNDLQQRLVRCADAAAFLDSEMSEIYQESRRIQAEDDDAQEEIVEQILGKIKLLYRNDKAEEATAFNKTFFKLFEQGDVENLEKLNEQIELVIDMPFIDDTDSEKEEQYLRLLATDDNKFL